MVRNKKEPCVIYSLSLSHFSLKMTEGAFKIMHRSK